MDGWSPGELIQGYARQGENQRNNWIGQWGRSIFFFIYCILKLLI
jgi:hypothetical protein